MKSIRLIALAAILVPLVVIAGCGGSSSSSSAGGSAANASATGPGGGARRAQIAQCLRKQGLTPPRRRPGGPGGPFFGGGPGGPNSQRFRAALQKCGITPRRLGPRTNDPQFRQAVTKFVACMRSNGFNMPAPNLSGRGPVLDPSKVNRSDPKFMAAARKCQGLLRFRRPGSGPPGGAPGSA